MSDQLKLGDPVTFNVGRPDGPLMEGRVVRMSPNGEAIIAPLQPGGAGNRNVAFFNIKKAVQKVKK